MPLNRDNFSKPTIRLLAERVAYRCSCPKCPNITIGPNQANIAAAVNLGEAAHIHAAAPGGPRYRADMTSTERQAISNGIWLCRVHARLIDSDPLSHPAELLLRWKREAETLAAERLSLPDKVHPSGEETLVGLDLDLLFTGIWLSVVNDAWTFKIKNFIIGNEQRLREHADHVLHPMRRYIIVESQNLGRLLKDGFEWRIDKDGDYQFTVNVYPAGPQRKLSEIGSDFAHAWDGDLLIAGATSKRYPVLPLQYKPSNAILA